MSEVSVPSPAEAPVMDPERLTAAQIDAIVNLRICPPAAIRSLTAERQLRWLLREQAKAIAALERDPRIEERALPKRNPDGTLARDPDTKRILYTTERVPVAEKEVERLEDLIRKVRAEYAAQLRVGPETRAARAAAEERYLTEKFGPPEERKAAPRQLVTDVAQAFRRLKGWA